MSHWMTIVYTCDVCGAQAEVNALETPEGWSARLPISDVYSDVFGGKDICAECIAVVEEAKAAALRSRQAPKRV